METPGLDFEIWGFSFHGYEDLRRPTAGNSCNNKRIMNLRIRFLLPLAMLAIVPLHADDGAASIAAGGLVVMGREPRIVMAKEDLQIFMDKVIVDYDFRNDSDEDVTTEVAFPIPEYGPDMVNIEPSKQGFDDFRLWVDGAPAHFQIEARAFLKNKECTQLLMSMHVDVASFGHAALNDDSPDIHRLTAAQRKQLEQAGLIDRGYDGPNWKVRKKYYWKQTFPAHKVVHIRHEYTPQVGSENSIKYGMGPDPSADSIEALKGFCIDSRLHTILQQIANSKDKDAPYFYVDFILTTANTWKTPIEDFTLTVERPHLKDPNHPSFANYVSFCWDGPITKIDADHFSAHAVNFVPKKELSIGFFDVEKSVF
jgi:hypothetical protein